VQLLNSIHDARTHLYKINFFWNVVPCSLVERCLFASDTSASLRVDSSILMTEAVDSSALVTEVARSSEIQCISASLHGKTSQKTVVGYFSYHCENLKSRWIIIFFKFEDQGWDCCALSCLLE
jgi:hypothetical protein